jgi:hypothetical protein
MQFDMNLLIGPHDPAIAISSRFAIGSGLTADTLLVASIQLRRLYHIYSDMAKSFEMIGELPSEKAAKLISLSVLTRTANRELEQTAQYWKDECSSGEHKLNTQQRSARRLTPHPILRSRYPAHRRQS